MFSHNTEKKMYSNLSLETDAVLEFDPMYFFRKKIEKLESEEEHMGIEMKYFYKLLKKIKRYRTNYFISRQKPITYKLYTKNEILHATCDYIQHTKDKSMFKSMYDTISDFYTKLKILQNHYTVFNDIPNMYFVDYNGTSVDKINFLEKNKKMYEEYITIMNKTEQSFLDEIKKQLIYDFYSLPDDGGVLSYSLETLETRLEAEYLKLQIKIDSLKVQEHIDLYTELGRRKGSLKKIYKLFCDAQGNITQNIQPHHALSDSFILYELYRISMLEEVNGSNIKNAKRRNRFLIIKERLNTVFKDKKGILVFYDTEFAYHSSRRDIQHAMPNCFSLLFEAGAIFYNTSLKHVQTYQQFVNPIPHNTDVYKYMNTYTTFNNSMSKWIKILHDKADGTGTNTVINSQDNYHSDELYYYLETVCSLQDKETTDDETADDETADDKNFKKGQVWYNNLKF